MPVSSSISKSIAIIAGAGPGTGSAIARRFSRAYPVVLLARSQQSLNPLVQEINRNGGQAIGITTDVMDPSSMQSTMAQIKDSFGADMTVAAAIYNVASKFTRKPFLELGLEEFLGSLETTTHGAFNFVQATLPFMVKEAESSHKHPPTLVFTGATASLRGGNGLASFAMSKFGVRAMAQSLAREFGPKGVHVSHVIIDGVINTEKTKGYNDEIPEAKIDPNWIAESYWFLHTQPRSSFTHELDLRPWCEQW